MFLNFGAFLRIAYPNTKQTRTNATNKKEKSSEIHEQQTQGAEGKALMPLGCRQRRRLVSLIVSSGFSCDFAYWHMFLFTWGPGPWIEQT